MIPMLANPKVQEFLNLLQDPEVYSVFKGMVAQVLTDPDFLVLKRISNIEHHLGADDDYCLWEDSFHRDKNVMIPVQEQLSLLSDRIDDASIPVLRETVFSGNETEVRAMMLKEHLPDVAMRNGSRFMDSKEVQYFLLGREIPGILTYQISEEHRTTSKAARKVANDVMKKTAEMFPETARLDKNKKRMNIIVLVGNR